MSLDTALRSILDKIWGNQTSGDQITQICDALGNIVGTTSNQLDINIKGKDPTISIGAGTAAFSYGDGALTTAYSAIELTAEVGTDDQSVNVPDPCTLSAVDLAFDTVVTATKVELYVAEDSAGKYCVSHPVEVAFEAGLTATFYVASVDINRGYKRSEVGTANKLWLIIKTDAGTANVIVRLRHVS